MKIIAYLRQNVKAVVGIALVAAVSAGLSVGGFMYYQSRHDQLPANIKEKVDFIVLYPKTTDEVAVDAGSFKYADDTHALSFVATTFGVRNVFTEQASPESFGDIPQYYAKTIDSMYGYSAFDTDLGRVDLTRPANVEGDQVAVMNVKGVLLFAHPEKDLTQSQWRKLFNNMQVVK